MDIHNKKTRELNPQQRQDILGRYLTMTNKLNLNYFKGELEGVRQEKEEAELLLQDQRRAKIYDQEDIVMMRMQNNEYRSKIAKLESDTKDLKALRIKLGYQTDEVLNDLFKTNETIKLYDKRVRTEKSPTKRSGGDIHPFKNVILNELKRAIDTEYAYKTTLKEQVSKLRKILLEEQNKRDELKCTCVI